jgi:hypothetical protein
VLSAKCFYPLLICRPIPSSPEGTE